ncbi:416_t:CDS:2, partial [Funneliformis geosporum]
MLTTAAEKSFFEILKDLELVKTNFIPLNKLAIKQICKKHAKYVGGVRSSVDAGYRLKNHTRRESLVEKQ